MAIGLRRSYGDSCLNRAGALIDMSGLDRFIAFDAATGVLRAEAGASLSEILRLVVPKGWFPPTTPGTRFVTLGGASPTTFTARIIIARARSGAMFAPLGCCAAIAGRLTVTPETEPALFASTIGGLGLTGVIEWVELQLVKIGGAYLDVEIVPYDNLDAFWSLADESARSFEHTVAWIDCTAARRETRARDFLPRQLDRRRRYDLHDDKSWKRIPLDAPGFALNRLYGRRLQQALSSRQQRQGGNEPPALRGLLLSARRDA